MRPGSLLFTLAAVCAASSAFATGPELHTVTVAVYPEDAAVAVDGHPRQYANGLLELRGALGAVFTVEAVANGASVVQRVAVTDVGALPARLVVPRGPVVLQTWPMPEVPMVAPSDDCIQRTWRDEYGVKHYKAHCLFDDEPVVPPPAPPAAPAAPAPRAAVSASPASPLSPPLSPSRTEDGFLTMASYPWTNVSENGKPLCLTPCVKLRLTPGAHTLLLENDSESVKQTVSVTIRSGEITVKRYGFK